MEGYLLAVFVSGLFILASIIRVRDSLKNLQNRHDLAWIHYFHLGVGLTMLIWSGVIFVFIIFKVIFNVR